MALNKNIVKQFKELHLIKYNTNIPNDIAKQQLSQLAELVRLTSQKVQERND